MLHKIEMDLKDALKTQDKAKVGVLRILISKCKNKSIATGKPLEDSEVMKVLQTAAKQHRESIKLYKQGQRSDLVDQETTELNIVEAYLPSMMTENEIDPSNRNKSILVMNLDIIMDMKNINAPEIKKIHLVSTSKKDDKKTVKSK